MPTTSPTTTILKISSHSQQTLYISLSTGLLTSHPPPLQPISITYITLPPHHHIFPAYLELQINGCAGFRFTSPLARTEVERVSRYLVRSGVGAWWGTVPTVERKIFRKVLPCLKPQKFERGAELLGAHCEGPWLNPLKKGAHDASLMQIPAKTSPADIYSESNISSIKMITIAPELPGSIALIKDLSANRNIRISLGHSAADYDTGMAALQAGATTLTHVFNAMNPLNHRLPGLAGLMTSPRAPYYSIIPDGIHLHPATVALAYRANPQKCILITDALEMAGLPDGIYPGHAQIPHLQRKVGNRVTIEGTETLIGSCIGLDECVRNLVRFSGCTLQEAVRCVTENVAELMGLGDRGRLEVGRRADFVVLDDGGFVRQTWIGGAKVYDVEDADPDS